MRKNIIPETSPTTNFADYSLCAGVESLVFGLEKLERVEVNPIERPDGSKDDKFTTLKTYLNRIKGKSGIVCRLKTMGDYAIIQRLN